MEQKQLLSLIADIAPVLKDFVSQSFAPLASRIDDIDKRLSSFPVPQNGKDADPDHVANLVFLRLEPEVKELKSTSEQAVKSSEEKINAAVAELSVMVNAAAIEYLKANPPPAGKDGRSLTIEEIAPFIAEETVKALTPDKVKSALLELPEAIGAAAADYLKANPPLPGKDGANGSSVTVADIAPFVAIETAKALTVDHVKLALLGLPEAIGAAAADYLKANPPPAGKDGNDGLSVTPADLAPFIAEETVKALTPDKVKSALLELPEAIGAAAADYLKANPPSAGKDGNDGLSVIPADLAPFIAEETAKVLTVDNVKTALLGLPEAIGAAAADYLKANPPSSGKDGLSVTIEDIAPLVASETAKELTLERVKAAVLELPAAIAGAVAEYLKANPPPAGENGSSVALGDLAPLIAAEAEKMVTPERVKAVVELSNVVSVAVEKYLSENPPSAGKDGIGISGSILNRAGELIIITSNGANHNLGCVVGKDAPPATIELTTDGQELDDEVAKQVAAAVRLLAELPDVVKNESGAPVAQTHIHLPDILVPEIKYPAIMVPEIKIPESVINVHVPKQDAPVVNISTPSQPAPIVNIEREKKAKKTKTRVLEHDAKGRVKEFETEELN